MQELLQDWAPLVHPPGRRGTLTDDDWRSGHGRVAQRHLLVLSQTHRKHFVEELIVNGGKLHQSRQISDGEDVTKCHELLGWGK